MHGANTYLGGEFDGKTICLQGYLLHAAMMDKLGITNPTIYYMNFEPIRRIMTPIEVSEKLTDLILE
jgi:hypothetical protein